MSSTVSVIMGVYNCKDHDKLEKSVKSIIDQSYTNWEFLICDDGSTDNTLDYLNKVKELDPRIKILHYDKNISLGNALNECLGQAKGKYIARQDDDDISKTDRFEQELKFLENHSEYCMTGCCAEIYDTHGVWGHYKVPEKPAKYDFLKNSPFMHPTTMMRREAIDKVGGYRVVKETRRCEDYDMFMRMYAQGMKGYNIQEEMYEYYMVHNDKKKHRPMKYRVDEAKVRYSGFKQMGVLKQGLPYIVKPIIAGVIPASFFSKVQNRQYES